MEKLIVIVGAVIIGVGTVVGVLMLGLFGGWLFGWIASWFFNDTFLAMFALVGIKGFSLMQIGAFLGFVGSFFKAYSFNKSKD